MVDKEKELLEDLNEGQKDNFFKILEFFQDSQKEQAFVLRGYAGTGKTFLIKRIVKWINITQKNKNRIAITAPTNKAVQVLSTLGEFERNEHTRDSENLFDLDNLTVNSISYSTIHKLLGLKEQISSTGQQRFVAQKGQENDILKYQYLIVDETSMLDDNLCHEIMKFCKEVKILFVGDGAQIPPINRTDSIPFSEQTKYKFRRGELSEIMRQKKGNPIIEASFIIRNNLAMTQPIPIIKTHLDKQGNGVIFLDALKDRDKLKPLLKEYFNTPSFKEDANYSKIIAWRNKTVSYMNAIVRELIYGVNIPQFVIGEKLIANSPIFLGHRILLNNSEEMEVLEIQERQQSFTEKNYSLKVKIHNLKVRYYDTIDREMTTTFITVIHEDDYSHYQDLLDSVKKKAIAHSMKDIWVSYFNIEKWSANVNYNYAITGHKA